MRRISFIIMALLTLCGVGNAQVSGLQIGYCAGYVGANPTGYTSTEKGDEVSAAIYVPADQVRVYAGNHIDEVGVGLASKLNVEQVQVWLRESLDGPDLATGTMTTTTDPALAKGWNTVALETPYDVTADSPGLYIGYTYTQKGTSKAIAILELPQPNALFVKLGKNAEWEDRSAEGCLSVQAFVYGEHLPKYNLSVVSMEVQPIFVVDKGTLSVTMMLRNVASTTITAFDALCQVDGSDEVYTAHIEESIAYNELKEVSFTIEPTAIASNDPATRTLTVTIDNLAEGQDEAMSDNTAEAEFQVVMHDFTRVPLVEEFTTEKCTNCPRVAAYLHKAAEDERFAGRYNTVEHHSGYYTDSYTIRADQEWEWFYDNVYAPAIMLDRAPEYGDASGTSVFCPSSQQEFNNNLQKELLKPAFVSLNIDVQPNEAKYELYVTVTGERSKSDLTVNPARITVMLTEDNLVSTSQAGYSGEYTHVNVGRRVNAIWGDIIEWDGDSYTYSCTLTYSPAFKKQDLGILAFIHDGDTTDKLAWEVCNSAATTNLNFSTATGIATSYAHEPQAERYFTVGGIETATPQRGLNIVRSRDGHARKTVRP